MISDGRIGGSTPAYCYALALIGQFFNQQRARCVTIAEVESGFLIEFFPGGDWDKPRVEAVHYTDVLQLQGIFTGQINSRDGTLIKNGNLRDKTHPLFPMGYDTFFRVLGAKLDRKGGIGLTICEQQERIIVTYWVDAATFVIREQRRQAVSSRQSESFNAVEIEGLLQYSAKRLAEQMTVYEAALKINPNDPLSVLPAAFLFEDDGHYADAEHLYQTIASRMKAHPEAHYHVARLALMRGDRRAAAAAITRALKANDKDAPVWDLHGRILQSQNKIKEAATAFERAVEIDAENGILHYHLAKCYEAMGRGADAERQMDLSVHKEAAPAWELVAEQMAVETEEEKAQKNVAAIPMPMTTGPLNMPGFPLTRSAETAAVPPLAASITSAPQPEPEPLVPLTTDFAELAIPWAQPFGQPITTAALASQASEQQLTTGQLTTFGDSPAPHDWSTLLGVPPAQELITTPRTTGSLAPAADMLAGAVFEQLRGTGALQASARPPSGNTGALPRQPGVPQPPASTLPSLSGTGMQGVQPLAPMHALPGPTTSTKNDAVEIAAEIMIIQRELEAAPTRADLHRKLGFLLAKQGRTAEAAAEFRKAIEASRTNI